VLGEGRVLEYDEPQVLANRDGSYFKKLLEDLKTA